MGKKHQQKNYSQKTNFLIEWGLRRWVLYRFPVSLAGRSHQSTDLHNSTPKVRNRGSQPAKQTDPLDRNHAGDGGKRLPSDRQGDQIEMAKPNQNVQFALQKSATERFQVQIFQRYHGVFQGNQLAWHRSGRFRNLRFGLV